MPFKHSAHGTPVKAEEFEDSFLPQTTTTGSWVAAPSATFIQSAGLTHHGLLDQNTATVGFVNTSSDVLTAPPFSDVVDHGSHGRAFETLGAHPNTWTLHDLDPARYQAGSMPVQQQAEHSHFGHGTTQSASAAQHAPTAQHYPQLHPPQNSQHTLKLEQGSISSLVDHAQPSEGYFYPGNPHMLNQGQPAQHHHQHSQLPMAHFSHAKPRPPQYFNPTPRISPQFLSRQEEARHPQDPQHPQALSAALGVSSYPDLEGFLSTEDGNLSPHSLNERRVSTLTVATNNLALSTPYTPPSVHIAPYSGTNYVAPPQRAHQPLSPLDPMAEPLTILLKGKRRSRGNKEDSTRLLSDEDSGAMPSGKQANKKIANKRSRERLNRGIIAETAPPLPDASWSGKLVGVVAAGSSASLSASPSSSASPKISSSSSIPPQLQRMHPHTPIQQQSATHPGSRYPVVMDPSGLGQSPFLPESPYSPLSSGSVSLSESESNCSRREPGLRQAPMDYFQRHVFQRDGQQYPQIPNPQQPQSSPFTHNPLHTHPTHTQQQEPYHSFQHPFSYSQLSQQPPPLEPPPYVTFQTSEQFSSQGARPGQHDQGLPHHPEQPSLLVSQQQQHIMLAHPNPDLQSLFQQTDPGDLNTRSDDEWMEPYSLSAHPAMQTLSSHGQPRRTRARSRTIPSDGASFVGSAVALQPFDPAHRQIQTPENIVQTLALASVLDPERSLDPSESEGESEEEVDLENEQENEPEEVDDAALLVVSPRTTAKYICHICYRHFTRPFNLRSHILAHKNVRPYVCTFGQCISRFTRRHDLVRHVRHKHEKRAEDKPMKEA